MVLRPTGMEAGQRLDHFLQVRLPQFSRARLQAWIKEGRVLVNEVPVVPAYRLRGDEIIEVAPGEPPPLKAEPENLPLDVLYEDEDVVVVNKPAGQVVHAGAGHSAGTLVNALLYRFGALSDAGGALRPGIVHRLDRYTSGVLVVARHDLAHRRLAEQFAGRRVRKVYLALVHGHVRDEHGLIEAAIARDPVRRVRMTARLGRGRAALTEYRVIRRFDDFTLLEVVIGTGRTHQIRVHLASVGHPVVGDRLYGAPAKIPNRPPLGRVFLHARSIIFESPSTGAPIRVEAPLPDELEQWMRALHV